MEAEIWQKKMSLHSIIAEASRNIFTVPIRYRR